MSDPARNFPFFRFHGSHRQIGRQFGAACRPLILRHRELALERLRAQGSVDLEWALAEALHYRPFVQRHAPFLDDEIQGVAEGAGISLAEAYLLQLRAELTVAAGAGDTDGRECTTFAVLPSASADGIGLAGQNADLPHFYSELGVVVELIPDDGPAVLMFTPAGQVSYIGMNSLGLCIFANFLTCGGWRPGFPRYLLSRLALTKGTVAEALAAVRSAERASSRNLLMLDAAGTAIDLETTPTRDAPLLPQHGLLAHANHYLSAELRTEERSPERYRVNSIARQGRIDALLAANHGRLNLTRMQAIMRDRAGLPDAICDAPGDNEFDSSTVASVIAAPARRELWVAVGPPDRHQYRCYTFSAVEAAAFD